MALQRVLRSAGSFALALLFQGVCATTCTAAEPAEVSLPRPAVAPDSSAPAERWYGREMLLLDVAGWGLAAVAFTQAAGDDDAPSGLVLAGAVEYLLGGPIVHLKHGYPGRAIGSLAARSFGMILGTVILLNAYPIDFCFDVCGDRPPDRPALAVVGVAAMMGVQALDNLNAREPVAEWNTNHLLLGPAPSPGGSGIHLGWVRTF